MIAELCKDNKDWLDYKRSKLFSSPIEETIFKLKRGDHDTGNRDESI